MMMIMITITMNIQASILGDKSFFKKKNTSIYSVHLSIYKIIFESYSCKKLNYIL